MEVDQASTPATPLINCEPLKQLLTDLKLEPCAASFLLPVDWRSLGLANYTEIVKRPMDLGTVEDNLLSNKYLTLEDFLTDLDLIWGNCMLFNQAGSEIHNQAKVMRRITNGLIKK
mgnify:CR=1 FL=1